MIRKCYGCVVWRTQTQQEFHEKQSLFSVQDHGQHHTGTKQKRRSDTRQTEGHRLNTQGNETQVETIRAWLETIR